jgi:hypothetical protein
MSRRTALIFAAVVSVALGGFLLAIDPAREAEGNPSILDFEFAWSEEGAEEIRAEWGAEGEDAARLSLWVDFAYLLAYGALLVLATSATRDFAASRGRARLAALGAVAVPIAATAPIFDAIEDVWLLIALGGHGGDLAPLLGGVFATAKFAALAVAIAHVVAGLVARLRARSVPRADPTGRG